MTERIRTEFLDDGRKLKVLEAVTYHPCGREWTAEPGAIVDGASSPRFLWTTIGGPLEGKYRDASVIHDVACVLHQRPWQAVHEAFYHAMLATGVDTLTAKLFFAAVYHFGPRWSGAKTVSFKYSTTIDAPLGPSAPPKPETNYQTCASYCRG